MGHCVGSCKSQENTIKVSSPVIKKNIELDF